MTDIEKAIKHFENMRDNAIVVLDSGFGTKPNENNSMYVRRKRYAELAIESLEKQIPKKPNIYGDGYDDDGNMIYDTYTCPSCLLSYETEYEKYDYCPHCGQALDWNEDE